MSIIRLIASITAGVLVVIGFYPYITAILRKETKPAKITWGIWAAIDIIALIGMYCEDAVNGQILGAVIGALIVTALSLKYGISEWDKADKYCLAGGIVGIALWQTFDSPSLGIITSCVSAFIGSIPGFKSAHKDPGRENKVAWAIWWISTIFALVAIPERTIADTATPISFFIIETIMAYLVLGRPYVVAWKAKKNREY